MKTIKNIWQKYIVPVGITTLTYIAFNLAFSRETHAQQKIEDSDLTKKLTISGQTFESDQDYQQIWIDNLDSFLDFFKYNAVAKAGEDSAFTALKNQFDKELSDYLTLDPNTPLLKLNFYPGIGLSDDDNPLEMDEIKKLVADKYGFYSRDMTALLFNRVNNIDKNAYEVLTSNESNILNEFMSKINPEMTLIKTLDKDKSYNINIFSHENTPEAREQAIKSAARTTFMNMFKSPYVDEIITNAVDDATRFSSQLTEVLDEKNISDGKYVLSFTGNGVADLFDSNNVIGQIDFGFEKIEQNYNAQKKQYEKTKEKPEEIIVEKKFLDYVHPNIDGTTISLNKYSKQFKELEKKLSKFSLPDVISEDLGDVELYARRLNTDFEMLSDEKTVTLKEMNHRDNDPQRRGYVESAKEIYKDVLALPESDLRNQLLDVAEQYALLTNNITQGIEDETGVTEVKKEQKIVESDRVKELKKLVREKANVFIGPIIGYNDGNFSYGGTIVGKWKNWGIGLEAYHSGISDTKDESQHNQEMDYGFKGDLTRIITENNNHSLIDLYLLRKINDSVWALFGMGLDIHNEGKSIYERSIVEKDGVTISDKTQNPGISDRDFYPLFVLGLNGYLNEENTIEWQLKAHYSNGSGFGINTSMLFDPGRLTKIGK